MTLNTATMNPATFNVIPSSAQAIGIDRGTCSWFERPMAGNRLGDRLQIVDAGFSIYTWTGVEWTNPTVTSNVNPVTGGIETSAGGIVINGTLVSGAWAVPPAIFRLLLNGTGTVTIDSRDAAGVITTGVFSTTLSGAVNQIEFPYAGDSAISICATLTGTATVKVI